MLAMQLWRWGLVGLGMVLLSLWGGQSPASAAFGFGESYVLRADQALPKDLYVIAKEIVIEGTVDGDLAVIGQRVLINGTIKGNTNVIAARIELNGTMQGLIRTIGAAQITPPEIAPTAGRPYQLLPARYTAPALPAQSIPQIAVASTSPPWQTTLMIALGFSLLTATILWLAPQSLNEPARRLEQRPWLTALTGVLTAQFFVLIPLGTAVLAALMAIFWNWFPALLLVVFIFTGFGLLWFLSPLITGIWLGRQVNLRMGRAPEQWLMQLLGVVLIALIGRVPIVGIVIYLLSFVLAVGAIATVLAPTSSKTPVPTESARA